MNIFAAVPAIEQWSALIDRAAEERQIDRRIIAALMLLESGGDPAAVSCCGAVGLMQVMPSDCQEDLRKWFIHRPTTEQLLDPETNVDEGVKILWIGWRTFHDDPDQVRKSLVAYYQGVYRTQVRGADTGDGKVYLAAFERAWRRLFADASLPWEEKDE